MRRIFIEDITEAMKTRALKLFPKDFKALFCGKGIIGAENKISHIIPVIDIGIIRSHTFFVAMKADWFIKHGFYFQNLT